MDKKRVSIALALIFLLALSIRFFGLGEAHPLQQDEALGGYDAYSLLLTGADSWGDHWPVALREYGMYATQLQAYLTMPSIALFGLNEFAVRFPWALLGSLVAIAAFIIGREVVDEHAGLVAALLAALSPWLVTTSRIAIQSNITHPFTALGVAFLFVGLRKPKYLVASALAFAFAANTYGNSIGFVAIFVVLAAIALRRWLWEYRRPVVLAIAAFALLCLPLLAFHLGHPEARSYASMISVTNQYAWGNDLHQPFPASLAANVAAYLDPAFLFNEPLGFGVKYYQYDVNHPLPLYLAIPLLAGLAIVAFGIRRDKKKQLLLVWLVAAIIAASLFYPAQNARRLLPAFPVFEVIAAIGIITLARHAREHWKNPRGKAVAVVLVALLVWCAVANAVFLNYEHGVAASDAAKSPWFGAGFREAVQYAESHPEYDKVFMSTNQFSTSYPYVYALFYSAYPPAAFQQQSSCKRVPKGGWVEVSCVGDRYRACSPTACDMWKNCDSNRYCENIPANNPLYVLPQGERPDLQTIAVLDEVGHAPIRLARRPT